jgi:hypothetical protein
LQFFRCACNIQVRVFIIWKRRGQCYNFKKYFAKKFVKNGRFDSNHC